VKINTISSNICNFNFEVNENKNLKINKALFHKKIAFNITDSNSLTSVFGGKRFFSLKKFNIIRPEPQQVRRDKEYIIERLKDNLIQVVKDRYDILGTHASITSFFDLSSKHDILLTLKNTKHLKVYGANNILFNNSKYVLFEIDDKVNLKLLLAEQLFFSKAELFTLYTKVLADLQLENLYAEDELLDYVDYSYTKTSTLKDILEFLVKTVESYQGDKKQK